MTRAIIALLIMLSFSACRSSKPVVAASDSVAVIHRMSAVAVDSRLSASLTDVSIDLPVRLGSTPVCYADSSSPASRKLHVHIGRVDLSADRTSDMTVVSSDSIARSAVYRPAARDSPKANSVLKPILIIFLFIVLTKLAIDSFHK